MHVPEPTALVLSKYCTSCTDSVLSGHCNRPIWQQKNPNQTSPVVEVVKEDASQAACLLPVLDQEVLVTPLLELGVEGRVVPAGKKAGN